MVGIYTYVVLSEMCESVLDCCYSSLFSFQLQVWHILVRMCQV